MIPDPDKNNWQGWCDILGNRTLGDANDPEAPCVLTGMVIMEPYLAA